MHRFDSRNSAAKLQATTVPQDIPSNAHLRSSVPPHGRPRPLRAILEELFIFYCTKRIRCRRPTRLPRPRAASCGCLRLHCRNDRSVSAQAAHEHFSSSFFALVRTNVAIFKFILWRKKGCHSDGHVRGLKDLNVKKLLVRSSQKQRHHSPDSNVLHAAHGPAISPLRNQLMRC